jgi:hypothetical protein
MPVATGNRRLFLHSKREKHNRFLFLASTKQFEVLAVPFFEADRKVISKVVGFRQYRIGYQVNEIRDLSLLTLRAHHLRYADRWARRY